jgi:hypothetical protein
MSLKKEKKKQTRENFLNLGLSPKFITCEILDPDSIKKLNFQ